MYTVQVVYKQGRSEQFRRINRLRISAEEIILFRDGKQIETLLLDEVASFDYSHEKH